MTMCANPYPTYASGTFVRRHNLFYSVSQILATLNVMTSPTMDKVFLTLLPIQTAPFCMTLAKKGVITQAGWHFYYTLALLANYALALPMRAKPVHTEADVFSPHLPRALYLALAVFFAVCRFKMGYNKYALWSVVLTVAVMCA